MPKRGARIRGARCARLAAVHGFESRPADPIVDESERGDLEQHTLSKVAFVLGVPLIRDRIGILRTVATTGKRAEDRLRAESLASTLCAERLGFPQRAVVCARALRHRSGWPDLRGVSGRPALDDALPDSVESVWFLDEAEMLSCLASDLVLGRGGRWWWRSLLRKPPTPERVAEMFLDDPASGKVALERLGSAGLADAFNKSLAPSELQRMERAFGPSAPPDDGKRFSHDIPTTVPFPATGLDPGWSAETPSLPSPESSPEAAGIPISVVEPSLPDNSAGRQVAQIRTHKPTEPSSRGVLHSRRLPVTGPESPEDIPERPTRETPSSGHPSTGDSASKDPLASGSEPLVLLPDASGRIQADGSGNRVQGTSAPLQPSPGSLDDSAVDQVGTSALGRAAIPHPASHGNPRSNLAGSGGLASGPAAVFRTEFGGILFALNAMLALGWYPDFTRPLDSDIGIPPQEHLARLGAWRFGRRFLSDPLASWLGAGIPRAILATEPPGRASLEERIAHALGSRDPRRAMHRLCRIPATVSIASRKVFASFRLGSHPLEIRMAGIDRDPGWIPGAGFDFRFEFATEGT